MGEVERLLQDSGRDRARSGYLLGEVGLPGWAVVNQWGSLAVTV